MSKLRELYSDLTSRAHVQAVKWRWTPRPNTGYASASDSVILS